jgi:hypothetical protein
MATPAANAADGGETPEIDEFRPRRVLYSFGTPWPEFNAGLSYTDTFRCAGPPSSVAPSPSLSLSLVWY